ncbi:MAG: WYL domain-containing protein [Coriobacteriia bacterium]|nr:WYL domain-containing protein [Coriobacteriia bacterium]
MSDAAERLVNLALYLASSRVPVTANECRSAGLGYPDEQDDATFLRMFERDKDALRAAGLVITVDRDDEAESYRIDAAATFARPVELAPDELAAVRAVAAALSADPGFPFTDDLALALGKLGTAGVAGPLATADLPDDTGDAQSHHARTIAEAVQTRKTLTFGYTNTAGEQKQHTVDPYGVFFREGNWYLIGCDRDLDAVRTYAIGRVAALGVNAGRPRTPDFERPADFDVTRHERLPFEYGLEQVAAQVRFEPDVAWRAERLARGRGTLRELADGSALWDVEAGDLERLATWIIDEGPAIHAVGPPELVYILETGLRAVADAHG